MLSGRDEWARELSSFSCSWILSCFATPRDCDLDFSTYPKLNWHRRVFNISSEFRISSQAIGWHETLFGLYSELPDHVNRYKIVIFLLPSELRVPGQSDIPMSSLYTLTGQSIPAPSALFTTGWMWQFPLGLFLKGWLIPGDFWDLISFPLCPDLLPPEILTILSLGIFLVF